MTEPTPQDLARAFLALAAGADPVPPPPTLKARLMAQVSVEAEAQAAVRGVRRLALAASALVLLGAGILTARRWPAPVPVTVAALSGDATVDGRPLSAGDVLPVGARLALAPQTQMNLLIAGRAVLHLKDGAVLGLERLRGGVHLRLLQGGLMSRVVPGTNFAIHTPAAVAAVRGTTFYVQVESPDKTYVCLCQGKLEVSSRGRRRLISADHHAALRAENGALTDAGMDHHTGHELD